MEREDPPPRYDHRCGGTSDDGIEALFEGEEDYVYIPRPGENLPGAGNILDSIELPIQANGNNIPVPVVIGNNITLPEPVVNDNSTYGNDASGITTNGNSGTSGTSKKEEIDEGVDQVNEIFPSYISCTSSTGSTSLELANNQVDRLTEDKEQLRDLLRQRTDEFHRVVAEYTELKLKMDNSDAEAKAKLTDLQKTIEKLEKENNDLKARVREITHESELTNADFVKLDQEQKSLMDALVIRIQELESQLDSKTVELRESNVALLQISEEIGNTESETLALANTEIDSLRAQLTSLLLEKESLQKDLKEAKDSHERDDTTRMALLEVAKGNNVWYKAQMDENRSSYEEERKERLNQQRQKDRLEEELAKLKTVLDEKNAELENLHKKHLELANEHINRGASGGGASTSTSSNPSSLTEPNRAPPSGDFVHLPYTTPIPDEENVCPICFRHFNRQETLVAHADKCGLTPRNTVVFP